MSYLLKRFKEKSTWLSAIIFVTMVLQIDLSVEMQQQIATWGVMIISFLGGVLPEKEVD